MAKTLKQLAAESLQVQDACNLSGVVHSFSRVMTDLWEHAREQGQGTEWVNKHPIVTLYIDKLMHLNDTQYGTADKVNRAYDAVYQINTDNTAE